MAGPWRCVSRRDARVRVERLRHTKGVPLRLRELDGLRERVREGGALDGLAGALD